MYAFALCESHDIFVNTIEFKCTYLNKEWATITYNSQHEWLTVKKKDKEQKGEHLNEHKISLYSTTLLNAYSSSHDGLNNDSNWIKK